MVNLTKHKEIVNFRENVVEEWVKERNSCFDDTSGSSLFKNIMQFSQTPQTAFQLLLKFLLIN